MALPCANLFAQSGLIVQGGYLGANFVLRAGDVDDDGQEDRILDLGSTWEVHSGATGLPFPLLTRSRVAGDLFIGLRADLDADGCDDLCYQVPGSGAAEFLSGRDGSLLFAFSHANLGYVQGAADHDQDGWDDVMVVWSDTVNSVAHYQVLSGHGGVALADFAYGYTGFSWRRAQWAGDVNGDGYVDVLETQWSFAQTFYYVKAGPDHQQWMTTGSGLAYAAFDTNGDGRDEVLTDFGYLDGVTGQLVWAGFFNQAYPMDLDGDGAFDIWDSGQAWSGRTQLPFPSTVASSMYGIGDLDGDGRDEAVVNGALVELVGGPVSSRVRDRGASGHCSTQSRPRIRHRLKPRLGDAMLVDLNGGLFGGLAVLAMGTAVDLDLAPFGAPSNRAYVSPITFLSYVADAQGLARHTFVVPNATVFVGLALSMQWAVFDPAANALGLVTSNALDVVVGN